jgi:hypothetical protein
MKATGVANNGAGHCGPNLACKIGDYSGTERAGQRQAAGGAAGPDPSLQVGPHTASAQRKRFVATRGGTG